MMGKFGLKYVCQQHISPIVYQYKLMAKMLSTLCIVATMSSLLTPGLHFTLVYGLHTSNVLSSSGWSSNITAVLVAGYSGVCAAIGVRAPTKCWDHWPVCPGPVLVWRQPRAGVTVTRPPPCVPAATTPTPALGDTSVASVSAAAVWSQAVDIENAPKGNRRVMPKPLVLFMYTTFKTCCLHSHL